MSDLRVRRRGDELTAAELHEILRLRVDVFVVEQDCAYPEIDGLDLRSDSHHVWVADERGIAGYVRLLGVGGAPVRVGRVVTRRDRRGDGLAAQLIEAVLHELGPVETRLEAQSHLAGWYERLGYEIDGDEYVEDGIPHVPMMRPGPLTAQESAG